MGIIISITSISTLQEDCPFQHPHLTSCKSRFRDTRREIRRFSGCNVVCPGTSWFLSGCLENATYKRLNAGAEMVLTFFPELCSDRRANKFHHSDFNFHLFLVLLKWHCLCNSNILDVSKNQAEVKIKL
jgi:hypothetical protein